MISDIFRLDYSFRLDRYVYILYKQSLLIKKKFLQSNIKKECNSQVFRITLVGRLLARPRLTRCRGSVALTLNAKEARKGRVHLPDDVIEKGRKERENMVRHITE